MSRQLSLTVVFFAVLAALLPAAAAASPGGAPDMAGRFIITLQNSADPRGVAAEYARRGDAEVDFVYEHALVGFAGRMSDAGIQRLRADGRVVRVERDGIATATETQTSAPWGLDRTDHRTLGLDGKYDYFATGSGVTAYVLDTGIDPHNDYAGRFDATQGFSVFSDEHGVTDCRGHGTHVAGTIGGTTHGIAKGVQLVSVRVLGCDGSGTWSGVIAGIDWVTKNAVRPAVANMSLGGGANSSTDRAVRKSIAAGVTYAVSAGNEGTDACTRSPARTAEALTVGATSSTDTRPNWSSYGSCLDLFAPGVSILSAAYNSTDGTTTKSGTSMAAPHVAGVAAQYLQTAPLATPAQVATAIVADGTNGVVQNPMVGSPNVLLYSQYGAGMPPTNAPPTASFTFACTGLTCDFNGSGSSDPEGGILSFSWDFGDGRNATGVTASHIYSAAGLYTVTLTVTDNVGATGSSSRSVTVSPPPAGGISLSASGYKVKGFQQVDLTWSGASSNSVDVYRDGSKVATTTNGAYTDKIGVKGTGGYIYRVCDAGTTTCSNDVTVSF